MCVCVGFCVSLLPTLWIKKMRSQNMGAERLQPQQLDDFRELFGNQLFFGGVALWACKGTSPKNVFGRPRGKQVPCLKPWKGRARAKRN